MNKKKLIVPRPSTSKIVSIIIIFGFLSNFFFFVSSVNSTETVFIMPLGDSITFGDKSGGYRQKLYLDLITAGFNVNFVGSVRYPITPDPPFDTDNEGHGGFDTDEIRDNVSNWLIDNPPKIVLLHIGTNDVDKNQNVTEIVEEVGEILDKIYAYSADITVILARIILRIDDYTKNETTKVFNNAVQTMAENRINAGDDIIIVDMENALTYPDDMADGEHPNSAGYAKMADVWYNAIHGKITSIKPTVVFNAAPTSGYSPLTVTFTDQSTSYGDIISWFWNFGDGQTSTDQNPTHTYVTGEYTVSLSVQEADGDTNIRVIPNLINVLPPPNSPPAANFEIQSSTTSAINETIIFKDKSSDTDGTIISWSWNFGDETTSTKQNPFHQYQNPGIYAITLTVKDDDGATAKKTKQLTIYENYPPVTTANYDGLWHKSDFKITLSAIDDYSGVAETYYKINSGLTKQVSLDGQPIITTNSMNNTLEFWSIDNAGNEEEHQIIVNIKLDKIPPNVEAGQDTTISEGSIIIFNGQNSNDNIQISNYKWELFDGTLKTLTGTNPQYTFSNPGKYVVTLSVIDLALNSAVDSITVTVLDITDPIANAGLDHVVYQGDTVTFDGSESKDNLEVVDYIWTFTDLTSQSLVGVNPTYVFKTAGVYEVKLNVTDGTGNWATDVVLVNVIDTTFPVANAGSDQIVNEDTMVFFDGSASFDNIGIISYAWSFTDGTPVTLYGENPGYIFENPDVYLITLIVSDEAGYSSSDTISIIVRDITAPIIEVEDFATGVKDVPISFDASQSYDNTGIANYTWVFGDGSVEKTSVASVTHIFCEARSYDVELLVTDIAGNVNRIFISVVVQEDTDGDLLADYLDEDDDGDGIPDDWEVNHKLDPLDFSDATLDNDNDGFSNLEEYTKNTNPFSYDFSSNSLSTLFVIIIVVSVISYGTFSLRKSKLQKLSKPQTPIDFYRNPISEIIPK